MNRSNSLWIGLLLIWSLLPMLWQLVTSLTSSDALVNAARLSRSGGRRALPNVAGQRSPFRRYSPNSTGLVDSPPRSRC